MEFDRALVSKVLQELANCGIRLGTSSWKYDGWCGQLYRADRYFTRKKFSAAKFKRDCLSEYAEVFKTVCVDGAYYAFPKADYLLGLASQVPPDFQFGFKVTDEITVKRFPNHPSEGKRAGQTNENFLNADLFSNAFLGPCESIRANVGILMFEFSRFHSSDFAHGREFIAALDPFLAALPPGWPYGIELRNHTWLQPEYFECLRRHGVAHVYNSWSDMPSVSEQMALNEDETSSDLSAARFLLKPGRKYQQAVDAFAPYNETKEVNDEARRAGASLIEAGKKHPKKKTFIFVNNRLEGNALNTIRAMIALVLQGSASALPAT